MRAGRLKRRVKLQSLTTVEDESGGVTEGYTTEATVWAGIEPTKGREYQGGGAEQSEVDTLIVVRYDPSYAIKPGWRVLWGARIYDIQAAPVIRQENRDVELACKEYIA